MPYRDRLLAFIVAAVDAVAVEVRLLGLVLQQVLAAGAFLRMLAAGNLRSA